MKKLRITVAGKTYDVEVEVLDYESSSRPPRPAASSAPAAPAASAASPSTPQPAPEPSGSAQPGDLYSPLSGTVAKLHVKDGDQVKSGDVLLVLEAMKMENMIMASRDGQVSNLSVAPGDTVDEGQRLLTLS